MQTCTTTLEISMVFSQKIEKQSTSERSYTTLSDMTQTQKDKHATMPSYHIEFQKHQIKGVIQEGITVTIRSTIVSFTSASRENMLYSLKEGKWFRGRTLKAEKSCSYPKMIPSMFMLGLQRTWETEVVYSKKENHHLRAIDNGKGESLKCFRTKLKLEKDGLKHSK
ncbi:hypothetical protein STEG23_005119, partial [Scotinomys teguina]